MPHPSFEACSRTSRAVGGVGAVLPHACMILTLVDYGIGNLRSLEKAFEHVGASVVRTSDPEVVRQAGRLVVPGVGAFGACINALRAHGLDAPVREAALAGTPLLGVCVGMQLLFEGSDEMGSHDGLGLLPGRVVRFPDFHPPNASEPTKEVPEGTARILPPSAGRGRRSEAARGMRLKVPHIGWSPLRPAVPSPLLDGLPPGTHVYFVHSYHAVPAEPSDVLAWADYGAPFPAVVGRNHTFGVQFHPEKSQDAGLRILRNFAQLAV
jgi:imidazole glycerol-phosphate synthase subunit HisH